MLRTRTRVLEPFTGFLKTCSNLLNGSHSNQTPSNTAAGSHVFPFLVTNTIRQLLFVHAPQFDGSLQLRRVSFDRTSARWLGRTTTPWVLGRLFRSPPSHAEPGPGLSEAMSLFCSMKWASLASERFSRTKAVKDSLDRKCCSKPSRSIPKATCKTLAARAPIHGQCMAPPQGAQVSLIHLSGNTLPPLGGKAYSPAFHEDRQFKLGRARTGCLHILYPKICNRERSCLCNARCFTISPVSSYKNA